MLQLDSFLVCDDVRIEIGNKVSLVGLYSDRIIIQSPQKKEIIGLLLLRLGFYLRFRRESESAWPTSIAVDFKAHADGQDLLHVEGTLVPNPNSDFAVLSIPGQFIKLPRDCLLEFKLSTKDQKEQELFEGVLNPIHIESQNK